MKCFKKICTLIIAGAVGITYTCCSVPIYAWNREKLPQNTCEALMKTNDSKAVQKTNTPMETETVEAVQKTEKTIETVAPFITDKLLEVIPTTEVSVPIPTNVPKITFSPLQTSSPVYTQLPINKAEPKPAPTIDIEGTIYPTSTETAVKTSLPIKTLLPTLMPEFTVTPVATEIPENTSTEKPIATLKPPSVGEEYCQIIYQLNGGKNHRNNPVKVKKKGDSVVLNAPSRAKCTFDGWYMDAKYTHRVTTVGNTSLSFLTLYAKWKRVIVKRAKFSVVKKKGKNSILVKLERENGVKGFEYVYAKDSCFKRKYRLRTQKNPKTLSKLMKKKIYYIKVRAYKLDSTGKKIYGTYSRVKKVKL